jgi:polysaccharide export outer membrane protein
MALLLAKGGFLMSPTALQSNFRHHVSPWLLRISVGVLLALCLWPVAGLAQYAGPAPNRADSPNPINKGLVLHAPSELLPGNPIVLHPGDLIGVSVYGISDYKVNARIAGDGVVYLPLVGGMHLAGMTIEQAQQSIRQSLIAKQMILNPDVLITVQDSMVDLIGVMGEVNTPKAIPAFAPMSLLDAIASAGGLKPDASHSISILRKGVPEPLLVVLNSNPANAASQNIALYPGDRVLVSRVGVVYVVGAVRRQGATPISPDTPMTLLQAVTLSGGINFEAYKSETRIIRTTGATRREIRVDLGKVADGKAPDPILQSDDIVMVPTNELKAALKGGGVGIAVSLLYLVPILAP